LNPAGFTAAGGRIYFGSGSVYDVETGQAVGHFNGLSLSSAAPYIDEGTRRGLFIERSLTNSTIAAYETSTFVRLDSLAIPGVTGTASSICRWAVDGIAFRATSGIAIVRTSLAGIPFQEPRFQTVSVEGSNIILHLGPLSPGQYQLEFKPTIYSPWSPQGAPFLETTTEIQIPNTGTEGYYRISGARVQI
jgi:hypothetical protein